MAGHATPPDEHGIPYREWQVKHGHKPVTQEEMLSWLQRMSEEEGAAAKKFKRKRNFESTIEEDRDGNRVLHQYWK